MSFENNSGELVNTEANELEIVESNNNELEIVESNNNELEIVESNNNELEIVRRIKYIRATNINFMIMNNMLNLKILHCDDGTYIRELQCTWKNSINDKRILVGLIKWIKFKIG
jgi:hypothetical protein